MCFVRSLFCSLLFLCASIAGFSQYRNLTFEQPEFLNKHLTVYQYSCIQDSEGFLWVGSSEGMARYDGYAVTKFTFDPDDTTSLASNEIRSIAEGPGGGVWAGTSFGGLCRFDKLTESFDRINLRRFEEQGWLSDEIYSLHVYRDSLLFIGTTLGLCVLEFEPYLQRGEVKCHTIQVMRETTLGNAMNPITTLNEDTHGNMWVGSTHGLARIPLKDLLSGAMLEQEYSPVIEEVLVKKFETGANGELWVATNKGLARIPAEGLDQQTERLIQWHQHSPENPFSIPSNDLTCLLYDSNGDLWVGSTDAGIAILPANEMKTDHQGPLRFQHYPHDPLDPNSVSVNQIRDIYEDRTQNVWLCTYHRLNKVNQLKRQFNHTYGWFSRSNHIWDNTVFTIFRDDDNITWIGSKSGLSKYDPKEGQVDRIKIDESDDTSPLTNALRFIIPFGEDSLLVTSLTGLWVFNTKTAQFSRFAGLSAKAQEWMSQRLYHILKDQSGNFWISSKKGLFRLNPETAALRRFTPDPNNPKSLSHEYIRFTYEDEQGNLWVGTEKGLDRLAANSWVKGEFEFDHFTHDPEKPSSLSSNEIRWITAGEEETLWIGTDGGGLNHFFPRTGRSHRYLEKHGLCNNVVYAMLPDEEGNLWISTNSGISKFNPHTEQFTNFDVSDGLQENEFNVRSAYRSDDGELFFGGINGFNHFYPADIIPNHFEPNVRFTDLRIRNESVDFRTSELLEKPITFTDKLVLDWRDNIFSVEFSSLEFSGPEQNEYKYQLTGFQNDWILLGNENKINFTGLDPGAYTLNVLGSNNNGVWSEEEASLKIRILPPPWRTWWAYLLYTLTVVGLITLFFRIRVRRIQLENALVLEKVESEKLREIEQVKSDFLANVSHELRTPLTLIMGPVNKLYERTRQPESKALLELVLNNSKRLLRMINHLLQASRLESNNQELSLESVSLEPFFGMIRQNFVELADEKGVQLEVRPPSTHWELNCDREKMEHIFYNLVSNALKFTPTGGKVNLSWTGEGSHSVRMTVADTGMGIPKEELEHVFDRFYKGKNRAVDNQPGTGLGLSLVKELVQLHGGTIQVESEQGKGTTFNLVFPLSIPLTLQGPPKASLEPQIEPIQETAPSSLTAQDVESTERPTILVVEDNADLRSFIRMGLAESYTTLEAPDGEAGLKLARETVPDLIITDVMMPKMDGTMLCKRLKSELATSHIPVIMLTARSSEESRITGLEAGADDYLTKPFNARELLLRVRNMLRFRDRLQQHFSSNSVEIAEVRVGVPAEDAFLTQINAAIKENLDNSKFSVEDLARAIGLGQKQLQRKLKVVAGHPPNQFIRNARLDAARKLLADPDRNVSEVGYMVGFSSPSYFAKCFQDRFGVTPMASRQ